MQKIKDTFIINETVIKSVQLSIINPYGKDRQIINKKALESFAREAAKTLKLKNISLILELCSPK
jgi:hypothetical protein